MEKAPKSLQIVIPAGGAGTRLWPRSRQDDPKQFLKLFSGRSIIQETLKRLEGFIPYGRIFIAAQDYYKRYVLDQLPGFLPENYITEPEKRGTSAVIGLAAMFIRRKDPRAVVHFLVADDFLKNASRFRRMIGAAARVADEEKALVVYGVEPTFPSTGLGYIQVECKFRDIGDIPIFKVRKFVEKPDKETAKKFLASGDYFWHCSGFTARCDILLSEMKRKWSKGFGRLNEADQLAGLPADVEEGKIARIYHQIEEIPIEYSILERAGKVMMAVQEKTWRDIGSWRDVYDISKKDGSGNVVIKRGEKGDFIGLEVKNSLIHLDDQLIAAIGVENLFIVNAGDAILICHKDKAQDVKKIVSLLKEKGKAEYL